MKTIVHLGSSLALALALSACGSRDTDDTADTPATSPSMESDAPVTFTWQVPEGAKLDYSLKPAGMPSEPPRVDTISQMPPANSQPELRWRFCGEIAGQDLQCAELEVPLDYDEPDGEKLAIALNRVAASPSETPRGALLFNPGGPGGSGKEAVQSLVAAGVFERLAPGFDIVGFDPRGVRESGGRSCGRLSAPMLGEAPPEALGVAEYVEAAATEGERCEAAWGPLFRELGSNNVVRDMERIRLALGEARLNFFGASYGTRIGALYAHAFPQTTGAVVLDAPVAPEASLLELTRGQFEQAVLLHEAFLAGCESAAFACPPEPRLVFDAFLADAVALGVGGEALSTWLAYLSSPRGRETLAQVLSAQVSQPDSRWILDLVSGGASDIGKVVHWGVHCSDDVAAPLSIAEIEALLTEFRSESELFASTALSVSVCAGWPTTRDPVPMPTATDAPPLLVIGGTQDLRTPLRWAQAMTEALGNATLLTSNHYGHGAAISASACVENAVRNYLTRGELPANNASCP